MNYFSKIKIGTWIVIILTLVNLASLGTILYKTSCNKPHSEQDRRAQMQRQHGRDFRWKQLNLSADQEKKFREKGKQYFDSVKVIYKLRNKLATKISDELKKDNPDKALMSKYSGQMGENYTRIKLLTVDHLVDLKSLCRPDQVHKLDSMYYFLLIGFENPRHKPSGRRPAKDSIKTNNPR